MERFCMVCNDKRNFRSQVDNIKRITTILRTINIGENYNSDFRNNRKLREIYSNINIDKPHIHFMCGFCNKVNKNELNLAFDGFKEVYISIISALIETEDEEYFTSVKYELKRLLSGHFPTCVRLLDRIKYSKDN